MVIWMDPATDSIHLDLPFMICESIVNVDTAPTECSKNKLLSFDSKESKLPKVK